ncbi:hypothetical protein DLAC_11443 [Tieghemostelium lacteum]|uniref:RING-type domain-containing protein n=1 Tax=Tieghemostelium lacteum TaxID=361077 RepID=A0A152AA44_TIELA|nr:hypothetical protein DLAC_11443 [Tieghemostelium lacteum]|eukprot:KYR03005.1 hypothetical protein DLAC_11443 [Tieghemostelium lacteum]
MGNQNQKIAKANNLIEFQDHVRVVQELINNYKFDGKSPNFKSKLEVMEPDIFKDTFWKLLTKVNCLIYTEDPNNKSDTNNKILQATLTYGQFYAFYSAIREYTGSFKQNKDKESIVLTKDGNTKEISSKKSKPKEIENIILQTENNSSSSGIVTIEETSKGQEEDEDKLCPICFDNQADNVSGECMHAFCSDCIEEWRGKSNTCPLCRVEDPETGDNDFFLLNGQVGIIEFLQKTIVQITK